MLLTIRQTGPGAEDLPSLLHHSPQEFQPIDFALGKVRVFFPEFGDEVAEVALLTEADPLSRANPELPFPVRGPAIGQYVNFRPYTCSALAALALEAAFPKALAGICEKKPEALEQLRQLEINLTSVPFHGEGDQLRKILAFSGFEVELEQVEHTAAGDIAQASDWGPTPAMHLRLSGSTSLATALRSLYLILALLDDEKDFWLGVEEVDGIWQKAQKWFSAEVLEQLESSFFSGRSKVYNTLLKRLGETENPGDKVSESQAFEKQLEDSIGLQEARHKALFEAIKRSGARKVLDLNANSGPFLEKLIRDGQFTTLGASNIAFAELQSAAKHLSEAGLSPEEVAKVQLFPGSPLYRDERTLGYDAVVLAEWIEHLDLSRLPGLEMSIFRYMKPQLVLVTTPNAEYNPLLEQLPLGQKRNAMHRFEWNRSEFNIWAHKVAEQYGYRLRMVHIGKKNPQLGPPCQMAHFTKTDS